MDDAPWPPYLETVAVICKILAVLLTISTAGCSDLVRDKIYLAPDVPVSIDRFTRTRPREIRVPLAGTGSLQGFYWAGERTDPDIIVFFHGRRASQGVGAKYAEYLACHGDAVLVASYPGFAGNPGHPGQAALRATAHAFAVEARRLKGPGARLWLVGHSLGAAVAIESAADERAAGVVAISPFTRLSAAAPWITRALIVDRWDNLSAVRRSHVPLLLIHGLDDRIVPPAHSETLLEAAAGPATLVEMPDRGHKPQMPELGRFITEGIAAMGAGMLAGWPRTPPAGWTVRHHGG